MTVRVLESDLGLGVDGEGVVEEVETQDHHHTSSAALEEVDYGASEGPGIRVAGDT